MKYDFEKYGYEYLDDNQIIMRTLYEILIDKHNRNDFLLEELNKRFSEQRQHIPLQERCEHQYSEGDSTGVKYCKKCGRVNVQRKT